MRSSETRVILDETNIDSSFRNDSVVTPTSVTGKKLTNLPAVSNTSILATDSMLQAFAKLQGQINNKISSSDNAATATKLQTPRVIAIAGAVSGSATFDGSGNISINSILSNFDASKIASGTISIERLPKGALERLVKVANQTARFALTTADVQEGDTVQQMDTGIMYFVIDTTKLNSEAGYNIYTAGSATSVPWSGVTGRPTKLSEFTNDSGFTTNKGTVTSVAISVPTGLSVSGSPITTSGTIALSYTSGYSIPTTASQANWNTAYSWGNHATKGYASETYVNNKVSVYLPLSGGTLTGNLTLPSMILATTPLNSVIVLEAQSDLNYSTQELAAKQVVTTAALAYWNGRYGGTGSNLVYCMDGEIASKS